MATYLIGDVHGCYDELIALLHKVEFTHGKDTLWLTGDLVARGGFAGCSALCEILRRQRTSGAGQSRSASAGGICGISRNKPKDRLTPLLEAPDADELLNWLRRQPLLQIDEEKSW